MSKNAQAVSMELFTPPHDDAPSLPCEDSHPIHAQGGVDTALQAPPSPSDEMDVGVDAGQRRAPSSHPYCPTQQHESIATIVRRILVLGFPFNVSQVSQLSITLVMFAAVGQFGSEALGGAALANGLMNATGYAFGAGLSGALETLLSHCYGHNPKSLLFGTHVQRMILLQLIVALPLGLLIANIGSILVWMGQSPDVVAFTTQYALIGVWALVPFMFLEVMRRYYATQHVSTPITVIIVVAAVLNIPLQHYLPSALGFVGAPIGWLILLVTMDVALVGYLVVTGLYRNTWGGWNRSALRHWGPMVKLAFPSLIMTLCEWSAMEINTIASGFAPPTELAAFTIMMQTALTMWTMPAGNYIAAAVLVGNCIGERRPLLGRTYAIVCVAISFAISCCSVSIMLLLGEALPRCFTDDSSVIATFMKWRWWLVPFHFGDAFQSTMLGIFRGIGKQAIGALIITTSFVIIALPLGIGLFLSNTMGAEAMWLGPVVGLYSAGVPLFVYFFRKTEWALLEPHVPEVSHDVTVEEESM